VLEVRDGWLVKDTANPMLGEVSEVKA
jgi:hypothetical protein